VGNPHADVLIVGEAPGEQEDLRGEPFVGRAGQLLNEMLGYAGLRREDIYIANVLKCRPPGNRNPQAPEIQACSYFLREQTRTIDPKFIVTLGNFAMKFILKTDRGITKMRGQVHQAGRFQVFPVYHPAYVLRNGSQRPVLQADFERLGQLLAEQQGK
jgi:DNA polymerase